MLNLLSNLEIEQFIHSGFVRIDSAFSQETAEAAVNILWKDIPFDRNDACTWTEPVLGRNL